MGLILMKTINGPTGYIGLNIFGYFVAVMSATNNMVVKATLPLECRIYITPPSCYIGFNASHYSRQARVMVGRFVRIIPIFDGHFG